MFDLDCDPITWYPDELGAGRVWWGGKYDSPQRRT